MAAKIALGYTLAELRNDITGASACAEPALDYVVVKLPRWPFDKFRNVDHHISMTMKSTGEVMAIGRSFEQAFLKALRSLDVGSAWLTESKAWTHERIADCLAHPTHERPAAIYNALAQGWTVAEISAVSRIHPWFIERFVNIRAHESAVREAPGPPATALSAEAAPCWPRPSAWASPTSTLQASSAIESHRRRKPQSASGAPALGITPTYKMVDTCAGEFAASTPYFYSTYEMEDEADDLAGPESDRAGQRPDPNRPGDRVRLLVGARGRSPEGAWA